MEISEVFAKLNIAPVSQLTVLEYMLLMAAADYKTQNEAKDLEIALLRAENADLKAKVAKLTEQKNKNSTNSSKPPSSDGLKKPKRPNLREKTDRKQGGQIGHKGSTLPLSDHPTKVEDHMPSKCEGCSHYEACKAKALTKAGKSNNPGSYVERRQVFDLLLEMLITEHRVFKMTFPMTKERYRGEFPEDVKARAMFGDGMEAFVVGMNTFCDVPADRLHEFLSGALGVPISPGTVISMLKRSANGLDQFYEALKQRVAKEKVVNFDETSLRMDGSNMWVHTACTKDLVYLALSKRRGTEGMIECGVLPYFNGIAIHDCWSSYWMFEEVQHGLCNAHTQRETIGVKQNHPEQKWPQNYIDLMLDMKKARERAIASGKLRLSDEELSEFSRRYDEVIALGREENPLPPPPEVLPGEKKKRGRPAKGVVISLLDRLEKYKDSFCLFAYNFDVPFDNNQAERDLRMIKLKVKVAGCFRTIEGAQNYLKIMSYINTARKHGYNAFDALRKLKTNPFYVFEYAQEESKA